MNSAWPFREPENLATFTLDRIIKGQSQIVYVVHDEDGDWQFLDGGDATEEDAAIVSLREILNHDSTIADLADLPAGWAAERNSVDQPWERYAR